MSAAQGERRLGDRERRWKAVPFARTAHGIENPHSIDESPEAVWSLQGIFGIMGDASSGEIPETNGVPELGSIPDRTGDIGTDKGSGSISGQSVPGHMKHRDQVMRR